MLTAVRGRFPKSSPTIVLVHSEILGRYSKQYHLLKNRLQIGYKQHKPRKSHFLRIIAHIHREIHSLEWKLFVCLWIFFELYSHFRKTMSLYFFSVVSTKLGLPSARLHLSPIAKVVHYPSILLFFTAMFVSTMPMKPERDKRTNQSSEENTRKPIREQERSSFQKHFSLTALWIDHESCTKYSFEQKFCITRTKVCKFAIRVTSFQASKCDKYTKKNHKTKLKVPVLKTFRNCSISWRYDF